MRMTIRGLQALQTVLACWAAWGGASFSAEAGDVADASAVERGRLAVTGRQFLRAEWSDAAYKGVSKFWGTTAPDPDADPDGYARAFANRYGFHPSPFPNDGLPMGLKRSMKADGVTRGMQVDCLVCHGGSIGGRSYVGMPNTQIDYAGFFPDLFRADGRLTPILPFVLNTSRGTTNAGMMSVALMSFRNADLSLRTFPLPMGTNLPELDAPPWWILKYKRTMYYDGRTPADSVRSIMQFLLAEKSAAEFRALEPEFADVHAYIKSLEAPPYPFEVDGESAGRGRVVFEKTCARCHGTYEGEVDYPNEVVPLSVVKTDPARIEGLSERSVAHYNETWFAERHPVEVDGERGYQAPPLVGIWASAPYLHNGSVPTLRGLLDSSLRPSRFLRPPSTDFEHYDPRDVGWKFVEVAAGESEGSGVPRRIFDASRYGLGNGGHTFGDALGEAARTDLIEYLKTL